MELNDQMALELLRALEATDVSAPKSQTTEQRQTSPLLSANQQVLYKNLDGFWQTVEPEMTAGQGEQIGQGTSQIRTTSLAQAASGGAVEANQFVDNFGDTYSVFARNTTQITSHVRQENQVLADAQTVSRAFQRDARRYAP